MLVIGIGAGNLFFPWLTGQLFESAGPVVLPAINMTAIILSLAVLLWILKLFRKLREQAV